MTMVMTMMVIKMMDCIDGRWMIMMDDKTMCYECR